MRWDRDYKNPEVINDPTIIPAYGVTDVERAYWNSKQDALKYDAEPTPYSDNHMISGAIYNALENYKLSTVQLAQSFFWGVANGLGETKNACENYALAAKASEDAALASENAAQVSESAAAGSASDAAYSASRASVSKDAAKASETDAHNSAYDSEAWAVGTRGGQPVQSSDPTYHNNARYYAALGSDILKDDEVTTYTTWSSQKLSDTFDLKADLVNGKVPASQLPSFVDDVKEYNSISDFPAIGESDKIYIDTTTNLQYRWSGTAYVIISESLALGETSSTAYPGNRGKATTDMLAAVQVKIPSTASSENKLVAKDELPTQLSQLSEDASHRTVTDTEKAYWDSKAAGNHNHDDRYYTKLEIETKFNGVTFTTVDGVTYINW